MVIVRVPGTGAKVEANPAVAPKPAHILGLDEIGGYEFKQDTILRSPGTGANGFLSGLPAYWGWTYFSEFCDRLDVIVNVQFPDVLEDYT